MAARRTWIGIAVMLAACAAPGPSATTTSPASQAAGSEPPAGASASATSALDIPEPGRPYDAADLLTAMRESRRPDGVPDELETDAIAGALADEIWTIGGRPWATMAVGASCGPSSCTVEVSGSPAGVAGEDLYVFAVDVDDGAVTRTGATLLGLAPETVDALDRLARERAPVDLDGYALASAKWLPPPESGRFVLAYRSGGEEGSPRVDLIVDAATGTVTVSPQALVRPGAG